MATVRPSLWGRLAPADAAFGVLWLAALGVRLWGLGRATGFESDQGEYYLALLAWVREGAWPLVGSVRAATLDHNLGPGWFYVLLPGVWAGGFHPAAGAAWQALLLMAGYGAAWGWLRRSAGGVRGGAGALKLLACVPLLLGTGPVGAGRNLWSPHLLLAAAPLVAWLLAELARARRPTLAWGALGVLLLLLPQIHTTALVLAVPAGAAWLALGWVRRAELAPARGGWAGWLLLLLGAAALLGPPLLQELRAPGHWATWLGNTLANPAVEGFPLAERLGFITNLCGNLAWQHYFDWPLRDVDPLRWGVSLLGVGLVAGWGWERARRGGVRRWLRREAAPLVLALAAALAWWSCVRRGEHLQGYYLYPALPCVPLLLGWAAGGWARAGRRGPRPASLARGMRLGASLLCGLGALFTAGGWLRREAPAPRLSATEAIVRWIERDRAGQPFSVALLEPFNRADHFHALLWRAGARPLNHNTHTPRIARDELGAAAYVIVRGAARQYAPVLAGLRPEQFERAEVADALILKLPRAALGAGVRAVEFACAPPQRELRLSAE